MEGNADIESAQKSSDYLFKKKDILNLPSFDTELFTLPKTIKLPTPKKKLILKPLEYFYFIRFFQRSAQQGFSTCRNSQKYDLFAKLERAKQLSPCARMQSQMDAYSKNNESYSEHHSDDALNKQKIINHLKSPDREEQPKIPFAEKIRLMSSGKPLPPIDADIEEFEFEETTTPFFSTRNEKQIQEKKKQELPKIAISPRQQNKKEDQLPGPTERMTSKYVAILKELTGALEMQKKMPQKKNPLTSVNLKPIQQGININNSTDCILIKERQNEKSFEKARKEISPPPQKRIIIMNNSKISLKFQMSPP